jgi:phage-related tail fiber protein
MCSPSEAGTAIVASQGNHTIMVKEISYTETIEEVVHKIDPKYYDETDPTVPNHVKNITENDIGNWDAAYAHSTSAHARTDATKVEASTNGKIKINGTDTTVYSHPTSGVTAGTYRSVTVNTQGHVTSGTNPTTLEGYGITDAISSSEKGASNGVATLVDGKIPTSQLPSYVDDVLEYSAKSSFPSKGETGKIYVDTATNKTYRWSGSAYTEISASLALGETSSTAYYGDKGKIAYEHSQTPGNPHGLVPKDIGLEYVENKSSAMIRSEITNEDVVAALGFNVSYNASTNTVTFS